MNFPAFPRREYIVGRAVLSNTAKRAPEVDIGKNTPHRHHSAVA